MKIGVNIKNKRARFDFELLDTFVAGIVLAGTEIKSIRANKVRITESFCEFNEQGELFVVNMHIDPYMHGTYNNHLPKASRKLLLKKRELQKLFRERNDYYSAFSFYQRLWKSKNRNSSSKRKKEL